MSRISKIPWMFRSQNEQFIRELKDGTELKANASLSKKILEINL
jgi:hypothetical protein